MRDRLSMADATNRLVTEARLSEKIARRVIVAGLIDEQLIAICDLYWRDSIPPISGRERLQNSHIQDEAKVPADFWRMEHAEHYDWNSNDGLLPTGSWGYWRTDHLSRFTTEIELTATAAAERYPDFGELGYLGSLAVSLTWTVIGSTLHKVDVDRLIERRSFSALLKRVDRKVAARWGNTTKSDAMRVIARCCATFLTLGDQEELAKSPNKLVKSFQAVAAHASEDAAVSDLVLRRFAKLVSEEASKLADKMKQHAPIV